MTRRLRWNATSAVVGPESKLRTHAEVPEISSLRVRILLATDQNIGLVPRLNIT